MATYGSGKVQLSFAEEEWAIVDLVGSTVAASTITGLSGMTASDYAGQTMRSLGPGTSVGRVWNVQDNTTTAITIEEANMTTAPALANTDDVSITQHGFGVTQANITGWIGIFDEDTELPDPIMRPKRIRAHGVGRHYADQVDIKWEMHSPLKFIVQDWKFLFFAFGHEYVTGTDDGAGGSDIDETNGTGIGDTHLDVTSAAGYATSEYIQVDTGTTAEVRQISAINTNALTLNKGMRFAHADTDTCNEVTSPYTHEVRIAETSQLPTFALCASYDEPTDQNRIYKGCCVNRLTLRSSTDSLLEAEMDIWAQDVAAVSTTAKPSVTVATTDPYHYRMVDGGISINSVTYARLNSFELVLNNNLDERYYHCDLSENKPFEHIAGGAEVELKANITITNMNLWTLHRNRTEHTVSINFDRTATSDEFTITLDKCRIQQAPHGLPREGPVNVDVVFHPHTSGSDEAIAVQVIDSNPYFGFV
jgi:hypothetical protein